jgi:tRNA (guanine26-N2/guanine27-N2)-dimethyltransferase
VFYNGAMALDRDLHVAVATRWAAATGRRGSMWEMLAATGVRGLRVLVESGSLDRLLSTDAGGPASGVLRENSARYAALGATSLQWDARTVVPGAPFDAVDLDPFGSPLPFLDASFGALAPNGLLSVTATDMVVLAGADAPSTRRRYLAEPVQGRLGPESGLRILLRTLSDRAEARGRGIRPIVCYVRDHYVRAYVLVGPSTGTPPIGPVDPEQWDGPPLRARGSAGPMWLGPLFDAPFVAGLRVPPGAAQPAALGRLLERFVDELAADVPFYYESNTVAKAAGLSTPPSTDRLVEALRGSGWPTGRTHARYGGIRTRAGRDEVYRIAASLATNAPGRSPPSPERPPGPTETA